MPCGTCKTTYFAGELVYLIFEVRNTGTQPVMIEIANPLSFCGRYKIEVAGAKVRNLSAATTAFGAAALAVTRSCVQAKATANLTQPLADLRRSGTYSSHVTHDPRYGSGKDNLTILTPDSSYETFDAQLEIVLETSLANFGADVITDSPQ